MVKKLSLEERIELARNLRKNGANCSRCVVLAFPDYTDEIIDAEILGCMSEGLGGGVGGCGLTCGAVTSMSLVDGLVRSAGLSKPAVYSRVAALVGDFEKNTGSTVCTTLKHDLRRDCTSLILNAVEILHNRLEAECR